ncbi:AbrB family transcriptional regulator [Blastococcus colisei]|uniref:AbrB family transcriptional regulator n=1 Tax=Blastococcus colisei TaxID=1564162 RepID=UPI001476F7B0|nr:AbrB family transcriptional regulator [Blastococcus colisei]
MTSVGISMLVGTTAGVLARRFRLPGGPMIAALVTVGVLHSTVSGLHALDPTFRTAAQIAIGAVLGTSLARGPLLSLRTVALPALLVIAVLIAAALGIGATVHAITGISPVTALLSFAPGGAADMSAAALKLQGDVPLIAAVHVIRQIIIFVLLAALFARFLPPPARGADELDPDR